MELMTIVRFAVGLAVLILGADTLVKGAARLAAAAGVSALVIGLTVVAFGTSAPEVAVAVQSALAGAPDVALGNVVGSNIFNVLFILGLGSLIVPLVVSAQLVRVDVPVMIGVSVLVLVLGADGHVGWIDGTLLLLGAIGYTTFLLRTGRRQRKAVPPGSPTDRNGPWRDLLLVAVGLALLVLGARWLLDGAVAMASAIGVSELVIGLTVVAAGTSLPEVATSLAASLRGERDIAVGNIVGSNIFNLLLVLGLAGVTAPGGVGVSPGALTFDIPVMIVVAVACLPIFFTGYVIERWEGAVFLAYYVLYAAILFLQATRHDAVEMLEDVILLFVAPLTVMTLVVVAGRELRTRRNRRTEADD